MAEAVFKVVKVLNAMELVVNAGATDGIKRGDTFVVYQLDDEITDPESGENLGRLERLRGTGEAVHVQERMTTVRSLEKKFESRLHEQRPRYSVLGMAAYTFEKATQPDPIAVDVPVDAPFVNPAVGDFARKL